jgi:hypothetical protein
MQLPPAKDRGARAGRPPNALPQAAVAPMAAAIPRNLRPLIIDIEVFL